MIDNQVPCGIGIGCVREEAEVEGIEAVAGMPVGSHPLVIHIAIFCCCCTMRLHKQLKHVNKDNVWSAEAPLLEGGANPDQNSVKENIGEGSIHGDDVSPCFLVKGMSCTICSAVIFVGTTGIVRYFVRNRWDWCKGIRIDIRSEEPVDRAWTRTEKKVHCIGRWGAMHLGTSTHVEQ